VRFPHSYHYRGASRFRPNPIEDHFHCLHVAGFRRNQCRLEQRSGVPACHTLERMVRGVVSVVSVGLVWPRFGREYLEARQRFLFHNANYKGF
jgi:hypothetical protein